MHFENRYFDSGFGREIAWDIPLIDGYEHVVAARADMAHEIQNADVLWLHGWQSPLIRRALRLAKNVGTPVFMRGENCDVAMPDPPGLRGIAKRLYLSRIFAKCHSFLAIGSANRAYYEKRGIDPSRIFMMPYAVDNEAFASAAAVARPQRSNLRTSLGIAPDAQIILFAGKLSRRKRPDLLIEAVHLLVKQGQSPTLLFVGDGEMRQQLEQLAPHAAFAGFINQSKLPDYYDLADVFVLPSEREPWGLAVNESMACGTPVVVSDEVGCAPDLVDGRSGIVFASGSASSLADALTTSLSRSAEMGAYAARKILSTSFEADISGLRQALNALGDQDAN